MIIEISVILGSCGYYRTHFATARPFRSLLFLHLLVARSQDGSLMMTDDDLHIIGLYRVARGITNACNIGTFCPVYVVPVAFQSSDLNQCWMATTVI